LHMVISNYMAHWRNTLKETTCHVVEMKAEVWQWVQTLSSLFLLCGEWTHGALPGHISVILAWRNRRSTHYSLVVLDSILK
jgi:hypothetical protein